MNAQVQPPPGGWQAYFANRAKQARSRMGASGSPAIMSEKLRELIITREKNEQHDCHVYTYMGHLTLLRRQWNYIGHLLMKMERERPRERVRVSDVVRWVSEELGISATELFSARRTIDIVRGRQLMMWLSKELTEASMPEMGRRIGGRDHTTVLHGIRKIQYLADRNMLPRGYPEIIEKCRGRFKGRAIQ